MTKIRGLGNWVIVVPFLQIGNIEQRTVILVKSVRFCDPHPPHPYKAEGKGNWTRVTTTQLLMSF